MARGLLPAAVMLGLGLVVVALACVGSNQSPSSQTPWEKLAQVVNIPWSKFNGGSALTLVVNGKAVHLQAVNPLPASAAAAAAPAAVPVPPIPQAAQNAPRIVVHMPAAAAQPEVTSMDSAVAPRLVVHLPAMPAKPMQLPIIPSATPPAEPVESEATPVVGVDGTPADLPSIVEAAVARAFETHHAVGEPGVPAEEKPSPNPVNTLMGELRTAHDSEGTVMRQLDESLHAVRSDKAEDEKLRGQHEMQKEQIKQLESQLRLKVEQDVAMKGKVRSEKDKATRAQQLAIQLRNAQASEMHWKDQVNTYKTELAASKQDNTIRIQALKKEEATKLRDLRLKMINEGARIKRVEEKRAVEAIAKFAAEDHVHLSKKEIEQASATVQDVVPNLDTEVKVAFPKKKFPRVYLGADD